MLSEPDRRRLRWRARRGLLENDLLLTRFLDRHAADLDEAGHAALMQLLELPDNDLLDLLMARRELDAEHDRPPMRRLLGWLRAA